ncbi:MAG: Transcriptional regulator GntR family [Deltaproteobacteria bacterium]|nr:Transcriptional regulator GntR family [Deltaproteobacteria bacterium]
MALVPISPREPAHQTCQHALRRAILCGELAVGERLPPERALAVQLGVSRLTLRAALATLDAAGLIAVRHGSGYIVRDFVRDGGPDLLAGLTELAAERGDLPPIAADLLRVRRHLAHAALEYLAEHPPAAAVVRAVTIAIEAMGEVGTDDLVAVARADLAVLAAVLDATRSPVLRLCLNPLSAVVGSNAALRAAIYRDPASNVAGWRLLAAWLSRPRAVDLGRMLEVLAARDAATLEHLKKRQRRSRSIR